MTIPTAVPAVTARPGNAASAPPQTSSTRPTAPAGVGEYFLPLNQSFTKAAVDAGPSVPTGSTPAGVVYHPALIASAQVRFLDRKYNLDTEQIKSALVSTMDKRGVIRWDDFETRIPEEGSMDPAPDPTARFTSLEAPLTDIKLLASLQKDFSDWVYRSSKISVRSNKTLGIFATPDISQADFIKTCSDAAREARDASMAKATATLDRQIASLMDKLNKEERELQQDQSEMNARRSEELVSGAETIFSFISGRRSRRISTAMSKHRMTEQSKGNVDESKASIAEYQKQLAQLEQNRQQVMDEAGSKWGDVVNDITEIPILPKKTDIYVNLFGVAWMPYYQVKVGEQMMEIKAFGM